MTKEDIYQGMKHDAIPEIRRKAAKLRDVAENGYALREAAAMPSDDALRTIVRCMADQLLRLDLVRSDILNACDRYAVEPEAVYDEDAED